MRRIRKAAVAAACLVLGAASSAPAPAQTGSGNSRIYHTVERDALDRLDEVEERLDPLARVLDGITRSRALAPGEVEEILAEVQSVLALFSSVRDDLLARIANEEFAFQGAGVNLPGTTLRRVLRRIDDDLAFAQEDLEILRDRLQAGVEEGLTRRQSRSVGKLVARTAGRLHVIEHAIVGGDEDDLDTETERVLEEDDDPVTVCVFRKSRTVSLRTSREDILEARLRRARRSVPRPAGKRAGGRVTDEYGAVSTVGSASGGYLIRRTLLELDGDVDASIEIGRFSESRKVIAAAGDGEFQCMEVSTVGSGDTEAFVSACGRFVAGATPGFQGYLATPGGAVGNLFLPGVSRAELRIELRSGSLSAFLREADTSDAFQLIATVDAPEGPLTLSIGAAGLGPKDEVGFDDLAVEAVSSDL